MPNLDLHEAFLGWLEGLQSDSRGSGNLTDGYLFLLRDAMNMLAGDAPNRCDQ